MEPILTCSSKKPAAEFLEEIQTMVTSTPLPKDFYHFTLMQPLTVSIKEKRGKTDRKPHPLPYGLRNPCSKLKPENSQDYDQKAHRNCTSMNSTSVTGVLDEPFSQLTPFSGVAVQAHQST
jgi:hypothetical protein